MIPRGLHLIGLVVDLSGGDFPEIIGTIDREREYNPWGLAFDIDRAVTSDEKKGLFFQETEGESRLWVN